MFGVAGDVHSAAAFEFRVSVDEETCFLFSAGAVNKGVGRSVDNLDVDSLSVLYVDCGSALRRKAYAVEHHGAFVFAVLEEVAVLALAGECVGYFVAAER